MMGGPQGDSLLLRDLLGLVFPPLPPPYRSKFGIKKAASLRTLSSAGFKDKKRVRK